jgi:hypothetical protein
VKRAGILLAAVASVAGSSACSGNPDAKAVAIDVVESLGLPPAQRDCMLEKLDGYPTDDLEALGEANAGINWSLEDPVSQGDEAFQDFVADLEACA